MADKLLRIKTVAEMAGVTRQGVHRAIRLGLLPTVEVAEGLFLVRTSAAQRYIQARARGEIRSGWPKGKKRHSA